MSGKFFLDTNILVYTFDAAARKKQRIARKLVASALEESSGVISWQVVQEFINVATRKFERPMDYSQINHYYLKVLRPLCSVHSTPQIYSEALTFWANHKLSFYDALIVAAASTAGCEMLYSEDLQHGQEFGPVHIENPF